MSNLKGPAGYMFSQVLNKRTKADNLQVAKREYDGKWLLWQYNLKSMKTILSVNSGRSLEFTIPKREHF